MTGWLIAAILCIVYYIVTLIAAGFSVFSLIWVVLAAVLLGGGWLCRGVRCGKFIIAAPVRWLFTAVLCIGILLFGIIEGMIIKTAMTKPEDNADYIIILGAQVKGDHPSQILYLRVKKAITYLQCNPDTKVIVSGGQGDGEWMTEAECMRRILDEHGIEPDRIIIEDQSTNTLENLKYSMDIVGKDHSFVISTCNFHQFRAQQIAQKLGAEHVSGLASRSNIPLLPNYFLREFFAVIKYYISGQI